MEQGEGREDTEQGEDGEEAEEEDDGYWDEEDGYEQLMLGSEEEDGGRISLFS